MHTKFMSEYSTISFFNKADAVLIEIKFIVYFNCMSNRELICLQDVARKTK